MGNKKVVIFLHRIEQIKSLVTVAEEYRDTLLVIPLDAEIEDYMSSHGMPFISGLQYRTPDTSSVELGEQWPAQILESKKWSFFSYRGVNLSQAYFLSLQGYLTHLFYYVDIVANVLAKHPSIERLIVFSHGTDGPFFGSVLVRHGINACVAAVSAVAVQTKKEILIVPPSTTLPMKSGQTIFALKRTMFGVCIFLLNTVIATLVRPKKIRILASDYWKNISPYVKNLDSAEIILNDRLESFNAGLGNIWRFRMRFIHGDSFVVTSTKHREEASENIRKEWKAIKGDHSLDAFAYRGVGLGGLLTSALDSIIGDAVTRVLKDIDDTHAMLERVFPHVVILRSTVSTQTHFVVLAQVAKSLGIPSIEMQHGLEYYGPGSVSLRHRAEFTCVYGPLTRQQMEGVGDTSTTAIEIGSPRFDVYVRAKNSRAPVSASKDKDQITILCVSPAIDPGGDSPDTYETYDYYQAVAEAVRQIPNARVIFKFRPGPNRDTFVRTSLARLFVETPYEIAQFETLASLLPRIDIAISCYSTALIESLQAGVPSIYLGLSPEQKMMGLHHFSYYEKEGAMRIATTKAELTNEISSLVSDPKLREALSAGAEAFLKKNYLFDGHSSERAAVFIQSLAIKVPATSGTVPGL